MFDHATDEDWEWFGRNDPYFGVASLDVCRRENLSDSGLAEFFARGDSYVQGLLATIRGRLDPEFDPRTALDFGCGVGRLTIPLATTPWPWR